MSDDTRRVLPAAAHAPRLHTGPAVMNHCLALTLLGLTAPLAAADNRVIDFSRDVGPVLARACVSCHGPAKQRGGLRLDDPAEAARGGNSGPVLKPGDARASRLYQLVAGLDAEQKMPPEGKAKIMADLKSEIAKIGK